jgi:hypothetical protein
MKAPLREKTYFEPLSSSKKAGWFRSGRLALIDVIGQQLFAFYLF